MGTGGKRVWDHMGKDQLQNKTKNQKIAILCDETQDLGQGQLELKEDPRA